MKKLIAAAILSLGLTCCIEVEQENKETPSAPETEEALEEMINTEDNPIPDNANQASEGLLDGRYQEITRETTGRLQKQQQKSEAYFGE